jgi:hypothetical protein
VAQAFDLSGITNIVGCPVLGVLCERRESEMQREVGLITCPQQNQIARSIACDGRTLAGLWNELKSKPHFSQRTREMGHPAYLRDVLRMRAWAIRAAR